MSELAGQNIKFLPGVGPKKAILLKQELSVDSYEDLLYHFPYKYIDKTKFYKTTEIHSKLPYIQVKGRITDMQTIGEKRQQRLVANFTDGHGIIELVWFKGIKYVKSNIKVNTEYIIFGKPAEFNHRINVVHPELEECKTTKNKIQASLQAFYPTSEKMKAGFVNSKAIQKFQEAILNSINGKIPETLPAYLVKHLGLINLHDALFQIHFPENAEILKKAQYRLKFEELFYIQLATLKKKMKRKMLFKGHQFIKIGEYFNSFFQNNLPFELTNAQKRVLKEIRKEVGLGKQMNRLLQGDVGSGKTLVGLMSMLMALDNGCQACLMAPTEILATQHLETIAEFLDGINVNYALLTGSTKVKDRKIIHEQLLSGELQIIIGTHALLEDVVQFKNLGFVIIDEQHRFGVAQRAKLWAKNPIPPHILVMTATPIPRTLAMTLYGDLEVSVIDELPPGRKPIQTVHYFENKRQEVYKFMKKQIDLGRQIYLVYPMIKESEKMDYKNLEEGYESVASFFPPEKYGISMVHGKMKPAEKEAEMQRFASGETQIMVATTVIEVGVNIPNASVMIIESTERFGLSQLHQLRGRVGRGGDQSYCILMSGYKLSNESKKRIETMVRTNDGFEIAEVDLKLRGPGDIEGTQQSGIAYDLKIANLAKDGQILQYARDIAQSILDKDPLLEKEINHTLAKQVKRLSKAQFNWSIIS
ncbi:ATP-dependent DNA helicase RecG [Ancylomarina sp. 16SWW S1-10-2]|uniref:ATP-dependent DNA helicase RecG n=1 Tax=Ancylomarina sp. 16SWW S1-10-2 TaxID=2499681 RepID=UPI0012ADCAC0|nr:ATP-dependent DNA helicase RecG [Ancylomarina sp. 16SWW S1-10-2]MRT93153.1 ATP-dependent DNA helicase RecG [Ancylomarina sp. 16SWW S1-10-2]